MRSIIWVYNKCMYIKVRVKTGQRREVVEVLSPNYFLVSVKEKPERNLANERIVEIFKERYKTKNVRIIHGAHHPQKMLSVGY
jgi:uncharacterized protein YggU (UPF0235/DUF167 family)